MPFLLEPYRGKAVVMDVHTGNSRSNVRDAMDDACWNDLKLSDTFDDANREVFRPLYHHTPVYGWMNDPNGMFYKDGEYHLYYQYNPYGSMWGNMNWGHSSSKDLISWQHHPVAIQPNGLGAVFSGSSVLIRIIRQVSERMPSLPSILQPVPVRYRALHTVWTTE